VVKPKKTRHPEDLGGHWCWRS